MADITIIGAGNMGGAIAGLAAAGGSSVQVLARSLEAASAVAGSLEGASAGTVGDAIAGEIVVLALPYPAVAEVLGAYADQLDGKVVVDITNPLDFSTFDSLVVAPDASAAAEIAAAVPGARVLKAFNTNFAGTLATGSVGEAQPTTVLIAGDDTAAKEALAAIVTAGGLRAVDAGSLRRAREAEALGFLQLTLAAQEKTSWGAGFALI
ncbi:NAD(P)-binding domain-containing protein [Herbiconiux moechotypicola]|uniref:NADPH-dependent F420 reductase n=1 Tax=Herbiconiux moechotypicola TaxID=637393 RepID=A0ABN3DHV5_9MICO|nr:NAD(P)-binding domain-containing protein [Herbiconiux moechotypicola]MCS5729655.1 NAD(P)-binding domain-containing protein [Herbiconiux moechotypicola]